MCTQIVTGNVGKVYYNNNIILEKGVLKYQEKCLTMILIVHETNL